MSESTQDIQTSGLRVTLLVLATELAAMSYQLHRMRGLDQEAAFRLSLDKVRSSLQFIVSEEQMDTELLPRAHMILEERARLYEESPAVLPSRDA